METNQTPQEEKPKKKKGNLSDNSLIDKITMRQLLFRKYSLQTVIVILVLSTIVLVAWLGLIDKEVTGTLLGTAIGSVLKLPFRSNNQSNDDNKPK